MTVHAYHHSPEHTPPAVQTWSDAQVDERPSIGGVLLVTPEQMQALLDDPEWTSGAL